jgi:hypothetical protein
LKEHGYNPEMAKSVEIGNASQFLSLSADQPGIVLGLLAVAYHDRVLGDDHEGLHAAFRAAVEEGRAAGEERVYFAKGTVAFFSTDDDVRAELRREDPKLFELLEEVWGGRVSLWPREPATGPELLWPTPGDRRFAKGDLAPRRHLRDDC